MSKITHRKAVGGVTKAYVDSEGGVWKPADQGLLGAACDPALIPGGNLLSGGVLQVVAIKCKAGTIGHVLYGVQAAGSGLTSAQCWITIYNAAGTKIATAVDQTTNFAAANDHSVAVTAVGGQSLTVADDDIIYVAFLSNGTTQVTLWSQGTQSTAANIGLAAGSYRYFSSGSAQTVTPATITPSSGTKTRGYWAAVAA